MSQGKKSSSFIEKLLIGGVGIVGGILAGMVISQKLDKKKEEAAERPTAFKKDIREYNSMEELMTCPISGELMSDPVIVVECGHTFQREHIHEWVIKKGNCPLCKMNISQKSLRSNFQLKEVIALYQKESEETAKGKIENSEMK